MAAPIPSKEKEVSLEKRSSTYSGRGTWYNPDDGYEGGNQGACGGTIHNTQMIVALVCSSSCYIRSMLPSWIIC